MVGSFLLLLFHRVTKRPILKRVTARIVSSTRRPRNGSQSKRRGNRTLPTDGGIELDSHADTVVLGSNAVVLHYTGNECDVSPYSDEYEASRDPLAIEPPNNDITIPLSTLGTIIYAIPASQPRRNWLLSLMLFYLLTHLGTHIAFSSHRATWRR